MLNSKSIRRIIAFASLFAGLSVLLGAFGAHALKTKLSVERMDVFNKGTYYLLSQSVAVIAVSAYCLFANIKIKAAGLVLLLTGGLIFSLSCMTIAASELFKMESLTKAGMVAPVGGAMMIVSWTYICYCLFKTQHK